MTLQCERRLKRIYAKSRVAGVIDADTVKINDYTKCIWSQFAVISINGMNLDIL